LIDLGPVDCLVGYLTRSLSQDQKTARSPETLVLITNQMSRAPRVIMRIKIPISDIEGQWKRTKLELIQWYWENW